jgi:hypothetical protein
MGNSAVSWSVSSISARNAQTGHTSPLICDPQTWQIRLDSGFNDPGLFSGKRLYAVYPHQSTEENLTRASRLAFGVRARASTFARAPVVERASLARPTLSGVHDRVVAPADKLCWCSCVVACRKGVPTQLEPPSRNCTRVAGLAMLTGICLGDVSDVTLVNCPLRGGMDFFGGPRSHYQNWTD